MLGIVLPAFEATFGMPGRVLYVLAFLAFVFFVHSSYCFLRKPGNWRLSLKIIAIANLLYCCLTLSLLLVFFEKLRAPGLFYFMLEIIIVIFLAMVELKTAYRNSAPGDHNK